MALPKLLQKLFGNGGAGDKLKPEIIPITVNGQSPDAEGNITISTTPPPISVAVQTLPAGSAPTVTKSGTDAAPVLTFGIPKGDKGDSGTAATLPNIVAAGSVGPAGNAGVGNTVIPYVAVNAQGLVTGYVNRILQLY